jgi:hypothetical protein
MIDLKLAAIDLDGTLLNDEKRVSPQDALAIECHLRRGVRIALASARDCASIRLKAPLVAPGLYFLGSGGTLIVDAASGLRLWSQHVTLDLAEESVRALKSFGFPIFLNDGDDYWVDRLTDRVDLIKMRYNLDAQLFQEVDEIRRPILRVSLAAPVDILERAAAELTERLGSRANVSLASPDWLDVLHPDAGKGAALKMLQSILGIGPDQTVAIGDYDCDLSLFAHARHRVAMGNASPKVKAAATYVTASNNDAGVAQALHVLTFQRSSDKS